MQIDYDNIKNIRRVENSVFFIQNDGTGFEIGKDMNNFFGQSDTVNKAYCKLFNSKEEQNEVREIKAVHNMTLIVKEDNTLWACGNNSYQSMGLGEEHDGTLWIAGHDETQYVPGMESEYPIYPSFVQVASNVKKVYGNQEYCSFIIKNDNTVWFRGVNMYGNSGIGDIGMDTGNHVIYEYTQIPNLSGADIKDIIV